MPFGQGAPKGNKYASKDKESRRALEQALAEMSGAEPPKQIARFRVLVEAWKKQIERAIQEGDLAALREMTDRLDGKAAQSVSVTGADGGPLKHSFTVEYLEDTTANKT